MFHLFNAGLLISKAFFLNYIEENDEVLIAGEMEFNFDIFLVLLVNIGDLILYVFILWPYKDS